MPRAREPRRKGLNGAVDRHRVALAPQAHPPRDARSDRLKPFPSPTPIDAPDEAQAAEYDAAGLVMFVMVATRNPTFPAASPGPRFVQQWLSIYGELSALSVKLADK
jgi:hypothetical protein